MTSKIYQKNAVIVDNFRISGSYYKLILAAPEIADRIIPGQFVHVRVDERTDPLLRRPFSVHRVISNKGKPGKGHIEILYEVAGRGTEILSKISSKKKLDILGPLGNGFTISLKYSINMLIAGGMGVAPLMFLAEKLSEAKTENLKQKIFVLIGAQTKLKIFCEKEFKKLGCDVRISTDDGSRGFKGKVTDLLAEELSAIHFSAPANIYACGPEAMHKALALIARRNNIRAQISLETYMACGFGVCMGCATNTTRGYKLVCKDGPVFSVNEISWR